MSPDDTRLNVQDELRLAQSALQAAEALLGLGLAPDAASRTSYAAFHGARALLFSIGVSPRSHEAVRSLLSRHFVQSGRLPKEQSKDLAQLEALRNAGDYDSAFALSSKELLPELEKAKRFVALCRALLEPGGS